MSKPAGPSEPQPVKPPHQTVWAAGFSDDDRFGVQVVEAARASADFFKAFQDNTERGTALALAADLDETLREALEEVFQKDQKIIDAVFNEYGPLGNLGAKARVAYLLNIFSRALFAEIENIASIRNKFAHRSAVKTFDHKDVFGKVDNLNLINHGLPALQAVDVGGFDLKKRNFRFAASVLLAQRIIKDNIAERRRNGNAPWTPRL